MDLDVDMSAEVFETPDPEVTFQAYAAVSASSHSHRAGAASAPEDAHFYDKSNSELSEDDVAPSKAFEAFMGKIYKPTARLPKQTEYEATGGLPSTNASLATLSLSQKKELESPLTRFTRLTMEIKELEADLTLLASNADAKKASLLVDAAQEAEYDEVMQGLSALQANLAAIEQNAAFRPFLHHGSSKSFAASHADDALALQKELTSKFFKQIEALKVQQQGKTSVAAGDDASLSSTSAPIVYEIYSNGDLNAVEKDAKTRTLALESRIATLEKAIGNFHVKELRVDGLSMLSTSGADLTSVVTQLEKRVNLLNEKNLDAIKTRTTALIHEFTLLNKLKESPSVQGVLSSHADREKIQQIYDKLVSIDDVSGSVPALVDRLVTLKSIHDDSLDMNTRVKKVEQSSETLAHLLETDTALLENIEKSLEENVKIFQSNMQTLDERMTKLLQSRS